MNGNTLGQVDAEELLAAVRQQLVSYDFIAAVSFTELYTLNQLVRFATNFAYSHKATDPKIFRLAHLLPDDYPEQTVLLTEAGAIVMKTKSDVRQAVVSLWFANHLNRKTELRMGMVGIDMHDDFAEINGYEPDWVFPLDTPTVAEFAFPRRKRLQIAEIRQVEEVLDWLFADERVVRALLAKYWLLAGSWTRG